MLMFTKICNSGTNMGCLICFSREVATLTCIIQNVTKSGQYLWKLVSTSTPEVRLIHIYIFIYLFIGDR
jgi:hypothetical protein